MDTTAFVSLLAGGASLAAGIVSVVMSGMRRPEIKREPRESRKAEIKALQKDVATSFTFSQKKLRRFRLILALAFLYLLLSSVAVLSHDKGGKIGPIDAGDFHLAALIIACLVGTLLVISAMQAYTLLRREQEDIKRRVEQISKWKAEVKPHQYAGRR